MFYITSYDSPLGLLTIASDGKNIIGLWLENQKYFGSTITTNPIEKNDLEIFDLTKKWLDRYFTGEKPSIKELPLLPSGNGFRQEVWNILCDIPYGNVITYGDIAQKIAEKRNIKSMSAQAIGGAVGHNPISIIIPCHRVVGKNNNLTGYAGGINNKLKLLEHEGIDVSKFFIPKE